VAPLICQRCQVEIVPGQSCLFIDDDGNDVDVDNLRIIVGSIWPIHADCHPSLVQ